MPAVKTFDTASVMTAFDNTAKKVVHYKPTYVANPRLAVGLSGLNASNSPTMAVKTSYSAADNTQYTANVSYGGNNIVQSAVMSTFIMRPADMAFQAGERTMVKDEGALTAGAEVKFSPPYPTTPKIIVFLTAFDMDTKSMYSIRAWPDAANSQGFTIRITAGANTIINSATASWIAFPEDCVSACCGDTSLPISHNQDVINSTTLFEDLGNPINFTTTPDVFIALNQIEAETGHAVGVRTSARGVDAEKMNWTIEPLGSGTSLSRVGITYLAFTKDEAGK